MIDKDRIVIECIVCGRKLIISNRNQIPDRCTCSHENTFVILENMAVITK